MNFTARELLAMTERALERLDWGQVYVLASAVLEQEPDNPEAAAFRAVAERRGGASSVPGRRQVTAVFIDLVDSTQLAERHDVEIYSNVLLTFEQACRPAIENHDGYIADIQGDAILACFGYPKGHEDDAGRAVSAALDMLASLRAIAADLQAEFGIQLQARIGIDTGILVIDGATVHGPALNRAARLKTLAEPDTVLISASTNKLLAERFETHALGDRTLKGIQKPVEVFQVTGPRREAGQGRPPHSTGRPLIGRDAEFGQLLQLWTSALVSAPAGRAPGQSSDAAVVLLTGEPGIGKSRIVSAVVDRTAIDGARSIELYCSSYSVTSTLFPFRTAIERYADLGSARTDGERLHKLEAALVGLPIAAAEIIPTLGLLLDLDLGGRYPAIELAPIQLREFMLDRLVALLHAYGSDRPVVMVFEDLQWADPTTLELLDRMARAGVPAGLLILATARPGLEWTPSQRRVLRIPLDPLSNVHARQLALAVAPGRLSEADAREIAERGDGVPLFIEQLAHAFDSGGGALQLGKETVPQTLNQLLQARLDSVGSAKLVAQIAATIGREFDRTVLGQVMAKLPAYGAVSVDRDLRRLVDAHLVEPMEHEGLLRFRHVLLRDAAYQSQLTGARSSRHRAAAEVLAVAKVPDPALTALHFDRAGQPLDALGHYLQAVRRAQAAGSFAEVLAHLERCEVLSAAVADETVRLQFELAIRMNRGLAVSSTAGYTAPMVVRDYSRARDLCGMLDGVPGIATELLKTLFGVWTYYCVSGDFDNAAAVASVIERQLDRAGTRSGRHGLDACRGVEAFCRGNLRQARELLSGAVAGMARDGVEPSDWWQPHDPMAAAYAFLGPLCFFMGDEAGAFEAIRAGLARSEPLEFPRGPFSMAFVRTFEGLFHRAREDSSAAAVAAEEVIRIGVRYGFFDWQMIGRMHLAAAQAMTSTSSAALDGMGEAITLWCTVGGEALIPLLLVEQAAGYLNRGDLDETTAGLTRAFEGIERGQRLALAEALRLRSELRITADPTAAAAVEAESREAIGVARAQGNVYSLLRAALSRRRLLGLDSDEIAEAALAEAVAAYGDATEFPSLALARGLIEAGREPVTPG